VVAGNVDIGAGLARDEPALRLVAQHGDEFGAIVGLATQRLVRDDDRGSRRGGRRNAVEHLLRDGDAVERVLGVIPVVDRDDGPAQARAGSGHSGEHMRADRFVGIADGDRNFDGCVEYLTSVRPVLARVASNVELLRGAADVDRNRFESELRFVAALAAATFLVSAAFTASFAAAYASRFELASAVAASSRIPASAALDAALRRRSSARALAWSVFAAASALSANASSASARVLSDFSLRSDAVSDAVSRVARAAAFFASSAAFLASAASRASVSARIGAAARAS